MVQCALYEYYLEAFMFKKLIGDKAFYKKVFALAIPIMIQNGITNFVNMLDNIMVGRLSSVEMAGVTIANQLIFVFNLCIFGALAGAGIFGTQFFGKKDSDGVRFTFRFKIILALILTALGVCVLYFGGGGLINLYLKGEGSADDIANAFTYSKDYLNIMLIGFLPFALSQCFGSTLRESDQPVIPMVAGIIAVIVNLTGNYILIFGHLGAPRLGVCGAAIATVASRYVELIIVAIWTVAKKAQNPFVVGAFRSLYVPFDLVGKIIKKGLPLLLNEALWSMGMATLTQCYSERGIDVVSASSISQTFFNLFGVCFLAIGVAVGIILGQMLGAGKTEEALDASYKLIAFSVLVGIITGALYALAAAFIPSFYNVNENVRHIATVLMQISALVFPLDAFAHASYFTLRSGGKAFITFIFDSGFVWVISVPVAFILSRYTTLPILPIFAICNGLNVIKCIAGFIFVKSGIWVKNIVN